MPCRWVMPRAKDFPSNELYKTLEAEGAAIKVRRRHSCERTGAGLSCEL